MPEVRLNRITCDVLVAGGGVAGVCAALAAARCGAQVVLCQDRPVLGGNASSEVRMHIVGAAGTGSFDRGRVLETEAREGGIIEEIRLETSVRNPQRSASMLDLILYEKCRAEPNLTLLLNTTVTEARRHSDRPDEIESVLAERPSTEDRFGICAAVFVDCSGDGRLGYEAEAPFMEGREARDEFNESLAQDERDNWRLGSTILLQARKHDRPMPFVAPPWARRFSRDELRLRLYSVPGEEAPTHEYGYWWAEWGGTLDTIRDNETIRDELLAVTLGIWDHVKNGPPGTPIDQAPSDSSHWALDWIGFLPGKRESRRFVGQYILTQNDLIEPQVFPDAIAYGGWALDLHPPQGVDASHQSPCLQTPVPYLYGIPLRSCVSRDVSNLMFAGRNISATHVAFSSTRVMATCAVVGQGVGTAAAHAVASGLRPADLARNTAALRAVQQRLLRDDAYLVGVRAVDEEDMAQAAAISASSEAPGSQADWVVSGQTRSVHGQRGAPPRQAYPGSHRWMSDAKAGLPAWLRLDWENPFHVGTIQLVFDTGLHRHLTLSHHDGYTARMNWGSAQPETVSDYTIEGFDGRRWSTLLRVTGNYQRLRRHVLATKRPLSAVKIVVERTGGMGQARVCEVRVWGSGNSDSRGHDGGAVGS